ncbi:MAG TPA: DOPA 4,5-dioxygenase family protein [Acetobacteraceae bacterium]|nr:DOPA 4,5-dioxygenase family protein [Acetobacteraceae bacterium]
MPEQPKDAGLIRDWHAHVYYDPERTKQQAAELRGWIEQRFPVRMGRWHDVPVGPHPGAMYQVAFAPEVFPALVPWLALNRQGLTVLVHPETDRPRDDHLLHAIWLGEKLPLKAEILPEVNRGE